jgi:hypothetical protein
LTGSAQETGQHGQQRDSGAGYPASDGNILGSHAIEIGPC